MLRVLHLALILEVVESGLLDGVIPWFGELEQEGLALARGDDEHLLRVGAFPGDTVCGEDPHLGLCAGSVDDRKHRPRRGLRKRKQKVILSACLCVTDLGTEQLSVQGLADPERREHRVHGVPDRKKHDVAAA
jgi:hypothetical protein